jgi:hypothetical protein
MLESGSITFYVPSYPQTGDTLSGITQDFINFYDSGIYPDNITITGQTPTYSFTGDTTFTYLGIGGSRLDEKKKYGSNTYEGITTGVTDGGTKFTGYTISSTGVTKTSVMYYRDFEDGYTLITGNTINFQKEEVINYVLSRNEHFLGFVEQPTVYSDVFVERGKQGVMEKNLRLGEIDNIGELNVYGNGFFKIKKQ